MKQNNSNNNIVQITPLATEQIAKILSKVDKDIIGLKLSIKKGNKSCLEMQYSIDYAKKIDPLDIPIKIPHNDNMLNFIIEGKSLVYLVGTIIDFETNGLNTKFIFNNPNAKTHCGCGKTFLYEDYFMLFEIKREYDIDLDYLQKKYEERLLATQNQKEKLLLTMAYEILKSPIKRAEYMISITNKKIFSSTNTEIKKIHDVESIIKEISRLFKNNEDYEHLLFYVDKLKDYII